MSRKVNEVLLDQKLAQESLYPVISSLTGQGINVRHACRALGVTQSDYYAWRGRPASQRALRRIWLAGEITQRVGNVGGADLAS